MTGDSFSDGWFDEGPAGRLSRIRPRRWAASGATLLLIALVILGVVVGAHGGGQQGHLPKPVTDQPPANEVPAVTETLAMGQAATLRIAPEPIGPVTTANDSTIVLTVSGVTRQGGRATVAYRLCVPAGSHPHDEVVPLMTAGVSLTVDDGGELPVEPSADVDPASGLTPVAVGTCFSGTETYPVPEGSVIHSVGFRDDDQRATWPTS